MKKTLPIVIILCLSWVVSFAQQNDWIHKQSAGDIEVYYRDNEATGLRELKMVYFVESSISSIVRLLQDIPNYKNWIYKLESAKVIERVDANSYYYYNTLDFPWPLENRDVIGLSRFWQDKNTGIVYSALESASTKMPEKENYTRIHQVAINWVLHPPKDGQVKIEYALQSDPGGNIPTWVINLFIDQGPLQTVKNMRRLLKEGKYDGAVLAWLKE